MREGGSEGGKGRQAGRGGTVVDLIKEDGKMEGRGKRVGRRDTTIVL